MKHFSIEEFLFERNIRYKRDQKECADSSRKEEVSTYLNILHSTDFEDKFYIIVQIVFDEVLRTFFAQVMLKHES